MCYERKKFKMFGEIHVCWNKNEFLFTSRHSTLLIIQKKMLENNLTVLFLVYDISWWKVLVFNKFKDYY